MNYDHLHWADEIAVALRYEADLLDLDGKMPNLAKLLRIAADKMDRLDEPDYDLW